MNARTLKDLLYEQVARIGKSLSSPKRLELLELLAQSEKSVETLASQAGIDLRLASAHLKALREARLVATRRDGRHIYYASVVKTCLNCGSPCGRPLKSTWSSCGLPWSR